jgi:hypothetical protein
MAAGEPYCSSTFLPVSLISCAPLLLNDGWFPKKYATIIRVHKPLLAMDGSIKGEERMVPAEDVVTCLPVLP